MAFGAEDIPENGGETMEGVGFKAYLLCTLEQRRLGRAGLGDARQVAFYIGHEHRHTLGGKAFRQNLQGDSFAGTCGAGNQAMTVSTA